MVKGKFSEAGYLSIINYAIENNYRFLTPAEVKKSSDKGPIIILRHDLDLDLDYAIKMAEVEKGLNIRSVYFILLFNNFYNPLSPENSSKIRKISSLGHEIGIHWDVRDYSRNHKNRLKRNIEILSDIVGKKVVSGSQHEPVQTSNLQVGASIKYEMYRDFSDFQYVSDSSMKWRKITPWDLISQKRNIHFLAHPFWWMAKGNSMDEKFNSFLKIRAEKDKAKIRKYYEDTRNFLKIRDELDQEYLKRA